MIAFISMTLFMVGLLTFSQWGNMGAIVQTCIMIVLTGEIIRVQYRRTRLKYQEIYKTFNYKLFDILVLIPAVFLISVVCYIPGYKWINILALIGLVIVHFIGIVHIDEDKTLRKKYIGFDIYICICLLLLLKYQGPLSII